MTHKSHNQTKNRNYVDLNVYDEEESSESEDDSRDDDSSSPEWVDEVSDSGDLFYLGSTLIPTPENNPETYQYKDRNASGDTGANSGKNSKKKPRGKLKSFIKASKVLKNIDLGQREVPGAEDSSIQTPKVTSFQKPLWSGEAREVFLDVDPSRHNYGRRASLCEVLFGIIPGHFHDIRNGDVNHTTSDDERIMVRGLIPDGEAMCCEAIKIGDWLRSVNDVEVTFLNIQPVLSAVSSPCKVKLTVQSPTMERLLEELKANQPHQKSKLAKLVSRHDQKQQEQELLNGTNCIVLYLTLEGVSELSSGKQDVVYQFPEYDNKLVQVRGMFVTLSHTLPDVTSCNPISSSLVCDEKLVHVGYAQEGNETFVLALPDDCISVSQLHHLVEDVVKLLKFQYQSLHDAFSSVENKSALDQMFRVVLHQCVNRQKESGGGWKQQPNGFGLVNNSFEGAHWLPLSPHIQMEIHNVLNEFEAADFVDLSDDYYDVQRTFTILGTCLFYRGYLLANHLPKEDMLDSLLYLKYYGLLTLTNLESLSRVVIWREVFPSRRQESNKTNDEVTETTGRCFMMIIGLKQCLFLILLEAGGCTVKVEGKLAPDPFYIDQAEATLAQLASLQIAEACEACLTNPVPSLANVDWFMQTSKLGKDDAIRGQDSKLALKPSKKPHSEFTSLLKNVPFVTSSNPALYDNESDTSNSLGTSSMSDETAPMMHPYERSRASGSDVDSRESSESAPYKCKRKSRTLPGNSTIDLNSLYKHLPDSDKVSTKLTAGCENTLFHYVHVNSADGIFVSSREIEARSMLNTEIMENFQSACLLIRQQFQKSLQHKKMVKNKNFPRLGFDDSLTGVKEQGVLFQCSLPVRPNQRKPSPTLSYWVVGRLFEGAEPQEFYVCYLDSVPQNVVELAFKLGFGMTN